MSTTAHLGLVHVEQAQAQKEVTINAALDDLDTAIAGTHTVTTAGGTTTLTAAEGLHRTIRVTGTLTSNATIVVPSARRLWGVINATTGSYSVTVKTSAGAGVVIPQGAAGDLVCHDGAEVVALGASSVFGRTGAVVAADGDYAAGQIVVTPGGSLSSTRVQTALVELQGDIDNLAANAVAAAYDTVGDGTATAFSLVHNWATYDLAVVVRTAASPYAQIEASAYDVTFPNENTVTLTFATAPAVDAYRVHLLKLPAGSEAGAPLVPLTAVYSVTGTHAVTVPAGYDKATLKVWGPGGGGPRAGTDAGGGGGFAQSQVSVTPGETLTVVVGAGGAAGSGGASIAGGGALTGVFRGSTLSTATPLAIAGGGGGGAFGTTTHSAQGGAGGGNLGADGEHVNITPAATGGTQSVGGTSAGGGTNGAYLTAGIAAASADALSNSAHGGAGYYGGGGGNSGNNYARAGAGGSGYVPASGSPLLAPGAPTPTNTAGSGATPANNADADYTSPAGVGGAVGAAGGAGRIVIIWEP